MSDLEIEEHIKHEQAQCGEPVAAPYPHLNGIDYTVHQLQDFSLCRASQVIYNLAFPALFKVYHFRYSKIQERGGLLRTFKHVHLI